MYLVVDTDSEKYAIPETAIMSIRRTGSCGWVIETMKRDYTVYKRPEFVYGGIAFNELENEY